jgi:hypothetical protein
MRVNPSAWYKTCTGYATATIEKHYENEGVSFMAQLDGVLLAALIHSVYRFKYGRSFAE